VEGFKLMAQEKRVHPNSQAEAKPRRRRRLSFSLRSFLVLMALLAIPFTWVAWIVREGQRQERAVEIVQPRADWFVYAHQWDQGPPYDADAPAPGPAWLRKVLGEHCFLKVDTVTGDLDERSLEALAEFDTLRELVIYGEDVNDRVLRHIATLHSVQRLQIFDCPVTDDGLRHLQSLTKLKSLHLSLENITDEGLRHLAPLRELRFLQLWHVTPLPAPRNIRGVGFKYCPDFPELEELRLHGLPIEDEALQHLARYQKLKQLDLSHTKIHGPGIRYLADLPDLVGVLLSGCPVPDEAVVKLKQLKQVRFLGLGGTSLSQRALDELRQALPDCEVSGGPSEEAKVRRSHCVTAKCLDENGNDLQEIELYVGATDDMKTAIMVFDGPSTPTAILGDAERLQLVEALKKSQEWAKIARESGGQSQVQDLLDLTREDTTGTGKRGLALRLIYSATARQEERCRVFLDIYSVVDGATATVICEPDHVEELISTLDEISEALDALREGKPVSY